VRNKEREEKENPAFTPQGCFSGGKGGKQGSVRSLPQSQPSREKELRGKGNETRLSYKAGTIRYSGSREPPALRGGRGQKIQMHEQRKEEMCAGTGECVTTSGRRGKGEGCLCPQPLKGERDSTEPAGRSVKKDDQLGKPAGERIKGP